ncbi:DUF3223 domain-containing protein [Streptomyces sp. NPDC006487]|uniref:DUF3223 domain-containing protein n=1 Tax=Streptomyces sp. NPDC006487 TaxID=3364748 RepID=UPI0036C5C512
MRHLITRHPDYEEKAGVGVGGFVVVRTEWNNRGLMLVRIDGSEIDISWLECRKATPHAQQVRGCLRRAVKEQVIEHIAKAFTHGPVVCEVTGDSISSPREADADHGKPVFQELAESFIRDHGGLEAFAIAPDNAAGFSVAELENAALVRDWQEHHRKHARLRVVTRTSIGAEDGAPDVRSIRRRKCPKTPPSASSPRAGSSRMRSRLRPCAPVCQTLRVGHLLSTVGRLGGVGFR